MPVNSRRNRKRKTKTKRKNPLIKHAVAVRNAWLSISWVRVLTLCTIAAVSVCVYVATLWAMNRPIQAVVIDGAFERVSAIQIEEVLSAHVKTGFLSADLNAMRAQLEDLSWIATAKVRRRWPGSIEVVIDEQLPVARWGDAGLLNVDGELFVEKVNHVPAELPRLQGPADSEKQVTDMYFRIEKRLERRGTAAVALTLDERGAWDMQLISGIRVRFGAQMVDARLERFFEALDKVVSAQADKVDYIDMRYTNGFAIGWKSPKPMNAKARNGAKPNV